MREHAGDRPLRRAVARRRARHLDAEDVLPIGRRPRRVRQLERVREEVALGRAEVLAVEPDVAEVEDAVEGQEPTVAGGQRRRGERAPAEQRAVGLGERRGAAPVPGDVELGPVGVHEVGVGEAPSEVAVVDVGAPPTRQVDAREGRRSHGVARLGGGYSAVPMPRKEPVA